MRYYRGISGLTVMALLVLSGCTIPTAPLRYRQAINSEGHSIVVSEWGVLEGTDPTGERVEVKMTGDNGREYNHHFEAYGRVTDSWAADLDADGKPEVVVVTQSFGTGAYGEVWVLTIRDSKWVAVSLPPLPDSMEYEGHDEFHLGGQAKLIRTFPVGFHDEKMQSSKSGRRIVYEFKNERLIPVESQVIPGLRPYWVEQKESN